MLLSIDRNSSRTIFDQLLQQIKRLIDDGALQPGTRLPSSRELADMTGINRSTVIRVYEELWASGYVESRPGSYTTVRKRKPVVGRAVSFADGACTEDEIFRIPARTKPDVIDNMISRPGSVPAGAIDLMHFSPDPSLADRNAVKSCLRDAVNSADPDVFRYSDPRGLALLRHEILRHMELHNIFADDRNILITNGSQHSLQLVFQAFSKPGDYIAVESPTYSLLFPMLELFGLKVIEIPLNTDGIDLVRLEEIMHKRKVRFIYIMPTFHNPAGTSMPHAGREKLLQICRSCGCIIIEDGIEEELKYYGRIHLPLKSIDSNNQVIYLGTFSKILAPGLRTGWIIASPLCISSLTRVKTILEISSNSLVQLFLYNFCHSGAYELHIRKVMRVMKRRMTTAISAIKKYIPPDKITWSEPGGGFLLWLQLNTGKIFDTEEYFLKYGVRISDGGIYFRKAAPGKYIRISISNEKEKEIEEGIRLIGKGISDLAG